LRYKVAVSVSAPLAPVTVTMYCPGDTPPTVVTVNDRVAFGTAEDGLMRHSGRLLVTPLGGVTEQVNVTVPV
jgi:hypothetical protein